MTPSTSTHHFDPSFATFCAKGGVHLSDE
eukprot:SAG31_NODE_20296_length_578_cov_1.060543_2_plen_28_part_01